MDDEEEGEHLETRIVGEGAHIGGMGGRINRPRRAAIAAMAPRPVGPGQRGNHARDGALAAHFVNFLRKPAACRGVM
ncbi:hypothetical protein, partial [Providencia rettgeri]|uniref:hypothetical protein n=1 Tax=Providencia rettgeri TaxID=587 RepID=UPI0029DDD6C2